VKASSLKSKFIIFAIIIIIPIATSNLISIFISKKINGNYNQMLNRMSITNEIKGSLRDSLVNFNKFIQLNTDENKQLYKANCQDAIKNVIVLQQDSFTDSNYILRDLLNSLNSYKEMGDKTIKQYYYKKGIDDFYNDYVSTKEIASYCDKYINKLIESYLYNNNLIYSKLSEKASITYKVLIVYILIALFISGFYTWFFLKNILDKLSELVDNSKRVSKGDFNYVEGKKTNMYELDILSEAFSTMIKDILKYINSLKENAELEKKLSEEEVNLLKSKNALKHSQLKILQSQINPHFLFNTLNCINQTAIKEKATQTEVLIKSVSGILRYSLSRMDRNATLEEEINVVKQYMYIQELRYEDRLKFNLTINADLKKYKVPGMTLQPFVENAFIHGIEPMEDGGIININITETEHGCIVMIEDTGCGIDESTINKILQDDLEQEHTGHTTGMGIKSVVKRLELMYDRDDMFCIKSEQGYGTRVFLNIPLEVED
jgi:two-component system, sensor histidine kinase YesM